VDPTRLIGTRFMAFGGEKLEVVGLAGDSAVGEPMVLARDGMNAESVWRISDVMDSIPGRG
jgi:hypothetical protein